MTQIDADEIESRQICAHLCHLRMIPASVGELFTLAGT
jgi:hypothetical protein